MRTLCAVPSWLLEMVVGREVEVALLRERGEAYDDDEGDEEEEWAWRVVLLEVDLEEEEKEWAEVPPPTVVEEDLVVVVVAGVDGKETAAEVVSCLV